MAEDGKSPGRQAFEAYERYVVAGSAEQPLAWEALMPERQRAWESAAQAAREAVTGVAGHVVSLPARLDNSGPGGSPA